MSKFLFTLFLFCFFASFCTAQEKDSIPDIQERKIDSLQREEQNVYSLQKQEQEIDSLQKANQEIKTTQKEEQEINSLKKDLRKDGIVIVDTLKKKKVNMNPLAPAKAAFYSAVFPGLGQIYNRRYWKAPIVWGLIGGAVYGYVYNDSQYKIFRTAFKRRQAGFTDDELFDRNNDGVGPDFAQDVLQNQQERFQNDRDLWLVGAIALYVLNIVDANVDAHLKQFNVDENLSFDMQPYLDLSPVTNQPNYGLAVVVKF